MKGEIMDTFKNKDEVLDFAIAREEEASQFYINLAGKMERPEIKKVFNDFAREEQGHKKKLEAVKRGEYTMTDSKKIQDMKITDYVVSVDAVGSVENLDYQDALILAMKKEKTAFRLYTFLSEAADNEELKNLFAMLAQEEARHKLRFELEYDEHYMPEN
jgi:rubrerythrin